MIDEFITLCQKIEEPVPVTENAVGIYPMPNRITRQFHAITFMPEQYQSQDNLDFGQLPLPKRKPMHTVLPSDNGQSMLLSVAIVLCLAGLLYILIYFTS